MNTRRAAVLLLAALTALPAGAEISREDLKKALDANPDLVLAALKKADKSKLFELMMDAQQDFQKKKAREEAEQEEKEQDEAIKSPFKPDVSKAHFRGDEKAPITIVEYSDFQCPYCQKGYFNLDQVRKKYGAKVRVAFKNYPLPFHPLALPAAQWFEAVWLQSPEKAWAFHDQLFENQSQLGEDYYKKLVKDLGLDLAKVEKDVNSDAVKAKVEADVREAKKFGFEGTPGYLVNGVPIRGAYPMPTFDKIIAKLKVL